MTKEITSLDTAIYFLFVNCVLCLALRGIVHIPTNFQLLLKTPQVRNWQRVADCFIAAMEESTYFFEFVLIYEWDRGPWVMAILVFLMLVMSRFTNGCCNDGFSNSLSVFTNIYKGKIKIRMGIVIFFVQMLAAYVSYWFAMLLWSPKMTVDHAKKYNSQFAATCSHYVDDSLPNYVGIAMLIEGAACTLDTLFDILEPDGHWFLWTWFPALIKSAIIVSGTQFTGGFYNPGIALGHIWSCAGLTRLEFFLIYFIGPILCTIGTINIIKLIVCETNLERKGLLPVLKARIPELVSSLPRDTLSFLLHLLNDFVPLPRQLGTEEEPDETRRSLLSQIEEMSVLPRSRRRSFGNDQN